MEHLTVYLIVLAYGFVCAAVLLFAALALSVFATNFVGVALPKTDFRRIALCASGVFPIIAIALEAYAISRISSAGFRGPEVLGIAILGVAAVLAIVVVWPLSYNLTVWLLQRQRGTRK